jgi:hypothetical protein
MVRKFLPTNVPTVGRAWLERALDGAAQLVLHEVDALGGHWAEVGERLAVARKARGLGELVSQQIDLLPETRARLVLDHRERRALLHGLLADLRGGPGGALPGRA